MLLAEDNLQDELLTRRALKQVDVLSTIDIVQNGTEALAYLFSQRKYAERDPVELPTVILLDLKLPKVSGLEVLEQLRAAQKTRLLPVVMLKSCDAERDLITSYKLGVNSCLRKSLDFVEFSQAVARLGVYWLVNNKNPYN